MAFNNVEDGAFGRMVAAADEKLLTVMIGLGTSEKKATNKNAKAIMKIPQ